GQPSNSCAHPQPRGGGPHIRHVRNARSGHEARSRHRNRRASLLDTHEEASSFRRKYSSLFKVHPRNPPLQLPTWLWCAAECSGQLPCCSRLTLSDGFILKDTPGEIGR